MYDRCVTTIILRYMAVGKHDGGQTTVWSAASNRTESRRTPEEDITCSKNKDAYILKFWRTRVRVRRSFIDVVPEAGEVIVSFR